MPTPSEVWRSVFGNYQPEPVLDGGSASRSIAEVSSTPDTALARSFIYRFLAKAFEDPSRENWAELTEPRTHSAFMASVKALGVPASRPLLEERDYDAFEVDYIACFGHTVRGDCPMNEIEYGDIKADPLFQPHRLADLGAFYAAFGLEVAPDAAERYDHISIELEFMSVLAAKEAYALEHHDNLEHVAIVHDAQKKFLREHLARWTPAFTRRLARMAGESALGALADFSREFILQECARFGVIPGSEDLLLRPVDETSESLCASCGIKNLPPGALKTD